MPTTKTTQSTSSNLVGPGLTTGFEKDGFISVTHAVRSLVILHGASSSSLALPLAGRFRRTVVQATNERKQTVSFKGVPVMDLPGSIYGVSATFVGADRYTQTVSIAELKSRKAILVQNPDGNYQLIVPGLKPSVWVNWLRKIELR